jgi:hypothetical protein
LPRGNLDHGLASCDIAGNAIGQLDANKFDGLLAGSPQEKPK